MFPVIHSDRDEPSLGKQSILFSPESEFVFIIQLIWRLTRSGTMGLLSRLRVGECSDSLCLVPSISKTGLMTDLPESGLLSLSGTESGKKNPLTVPGDTCTANYTDSCRKHTREINRICFFPACIEHLGWHHYLSPLQGHIGV